MAARKKNTLHFEIKVLDENKERKREEDDHSSNWDE